MEQTEVVLDGLSDDMFVKLHTIECWQHQHTKHYQFADTYLLIIVTNGEAVLEVDQQRMELKKHAVYNCSYGATYCLLEPSNQFEAYVFSFDIYVQNEIEKWSLKQDIPILSHILEIHRTEEILELCHTLWQIRDTTVVLDKFRRQIEFQQLLLLILSASRNMEKKVYLSMEDVKQYIEAHYKEQITIEKLANLVKLSPKYFTELFKQKYGITAMGLISKLRLQEARRLMHKGDCSVKEIAHQVGYKDEFYFSRKFKKEIGLTPSRYMRNTKKRIIAYTPNIIGQLIPLNIIPYAAPLHPKWTAYYHQRYRREIPLHLSAYRVNENWQENLSKLADEKADVIITAGSIQQDERRLLEAKADVLYLPEDLDWQERFLYIARRLDESQQAEAWLAAYHQQIVRVKENMLDHLGKQRAAVIRLIGDNLYLESGNPRFAFLYEDWQLFERPNVASCHQQITVKDLNALEADTIFMLIRQDHQTRKHWLDLQKQPIWQRLSAVREQRILIVSSDPWLEDSAHAHLRKLQSIKALYQ